MFLIIRTVGSTTATGHRPLLWVLVGLFGMATPDSTYAYLVEVGSEVPPSSIVSPVTPYVPVLIGLSVVIYELERHHQVEPAQEAR